MTSYGEATHLDLFSGIGGFALAAQWAGFCTIAFCEIEPYCQAILQARFGAVMADTESREWGESQARNGRQMLTGGSPQIHSDIFRLDGRLYTGVSLVTGGFPCQPFSCAGKRRGKEDDRFLWPEMLRIVSEARPAWVLGENVAGIVQMELDRVLSDLENIGYAVWPLVIPACAVDARHRRDRVWIIANSANTRLPGNDSPCNHAWKISPDIQQQWGRGSGGASGCGEAMANRNQSRLQVSRGCGESCGESCGENPTAFGSSGSVVQWLPESGVGRVAHGIPARVDRLKGLGNAIVPQVAYEILKAIRMTL